VGRARYVATAAVVNLSVTRGFLLNHLIMNAAGGTTNFRLFSAFRLKSVELWATTATLGSPVTSSVEWTSSNGPSIIHSDTSIGTAEPAHVKTGVPQQSLASFWSISGTNESEALFILNLANGGIVDITYEAVIQNGETPVSATTTNAGVAGTVYMTYLGGVTSTALAPQSYAALT